MSKTLKWILISLLSLIASLVVAFKIIQWQTKKASPEDTVVYKKNALNIEVFYNRPSKRNRVIFGGLVPFGKVWRTGANEATTFETNADLLIEGKTLKAGKYTLWTIPEEDHWLVIFNYKMYPWGVNRDDEIAQREPDYDAMEIKVPVEPQIGITEMFTIRLEDNPTTALSFTWDQTRVAVPFSVK